MPDAHYYKYMRSKQWKQKRNAFWKSKNRVKSCMGCGREYELGFELHHKTYKRFKHELLDDLIPMCRGCHVALHRMKADEHLNLHTATLRSTKEQRVKWNALKKDSPRTYQRLLNDQWKSVMRIRFNKNI